MSNNWLLSCDDINKLFGVMFHDSEVALSMTEVRTKFYLINFVCFPISKMFQKQKFMPHLYLWYTMKV